jgi:5-methylcytosine-specific restriction endonuclease McrA
MISKKTRQLVSERANDTCEWCHRAWGTQLHHIKRKSQGGSDDISNLMLVCFSCHHKIHTDITNIRKMKEYINSEMNKNAEK